MIIGILTYHRSHNYGALLQAIALRTVLAGMGHQATFIDYWPAYHRHMYALFSWHRMREYDGFKRKISYFKSCLLNFRSRQRRIAYFNDFIKQYIEPYTSSMDEEYDLVIHGSDQIWRKQPEIKAYNPVYFGKHDIRSNRKISYAASMGVLPNRIEDIDILKDYLSNLDVISVRENDLLSALKQWGYKQAKQDLDPTLLLSKEDWIRLFGLHDKRKEKFILYYKIKDSFDYNEINDYAQSHGMKLRILHHIADCQNTDEHIVYANPKKFLELFWEADFIFTSSFHGVVFSLIFGKPFLASFTDNSSRAQSLLGILGLSNRLLKPKSKISKTIPVINYDDVKSHLNMLRQESLNSLSKVIFP